MVISMLCWSKLVYNFLPLPFTEKVIKTLKAWPLAFLFQTRQHINCKCLIHKSGNGGISVVNTSRKLLALKASWVSRWLQKLGINVSINTDCEGICCGIYARQKFKKIPGTRALLGTFGRRKSHNKYRAGGIYYYYKDRLLCFKEIHFIFASWPQTKMLPSWILFWLWSVAIFLSSAQFLCARKIQNYSRCWADSYWRFYPFKFLCAQMSFVSPRRRVLPVFIMWNIIK